LPQHSSNASLSVVSSVCSSIISEENGRATALLKSSSKRKRTKSEIEDVKEEEEFLK
jgi:hypothetical protein